LKYGTNLIAVSKDSCVAGVIIILTGFKIGVLSFRSNDNNELKLFDRLRFFIVSGVWRAL